MNYSQTDIILMMMTLTCDYLMMMMRQLLTENITEDTPAQVVLDLGKFSRCSN